MTTRPGASIQAELRFSTVKRLATILRIRKITGEEFYYTTHDRPISFEGQTYVPAVARSADSDIRRMGLRPAEQAFAGLIDGNEITFESLRRKEFNGASVWLVDLDWSRPWVAYGRHYFTMRATRNSDNTWSCALQGSGIEFQRPRGGRFGGVASYGCNYAIGGEFCKKDISADTVIGARVSTVVEERSIFTLTPASYTTGVWSNDYFREGEIKWMWSWPSISGTVTSTTTSGVLTDSTKSWVSGELVGRYVRVLTGTNGPVIAYAVIESNDATHVYYSSIVPTTYGTMSGYTAGQHYDIAPKSLNFGKVTPIIRHIDASRYFELLIPTPSPIMIADSGILKPGCNGLDSTCRTKFNNMANYGGRHLQPRPSDRMEAVK